jgi:hypothetical protein
VKKARLWDPLPVPPGWPWQGSGTPPSPNVALDPDTLQADYETIMGLRKACEKAERAVGGRAAGIQGPLLITAIRRITEAALVAEYRCAQALAEEQSPGVTAKGSVANAIPVARSRRRGR